MMSWYSHPKALTFKLTELPAGYPKGFTFPPGVTPNTASYFDRGWCFCESSVSNMVKDSSMVLDLAKFSGEARDLDALTKECRSGEVPMERCAKKFGLNPDDYR